MSVTLEPIAWHSDETPFIWIVRFHREPEPILGVSPYVGSGTAIADYAKLQVEIKGVTMPGFNIAAWKAIDVAFKAIGFAKVVYDRRNIGNKKRPFSIDI